MNINRKPRGQRDIGETIILVAAAGIAAMTLTAASVSRPTTVEPTNMPPRPYACIEVWRNEEREEFQSEEHIEEALLRLSDMTPAVAATAAPTVARAKLLDIPLDAETQAQIREICGSRELFCAVMAIANTESGYDTAAVGDGGKSLGMMQINTRWQKDRFARLGLAAEDMFTPTAAVTVALDIIDWLADNLGMTPDSAVGTHALYMAYNMGLQGSRDAGYDTTAYSRKTLATYNAYLAEVTE